MNKNKIGVCTDCNVVFNDDGTTNNCVCPKCNGIHYTFYNLITIIKFNYSGKIHIVQLDKLAKAVDFFCIIETQDWFNGNQRYDCYDVEGGTLDKRKPIPKELYNRQINISYGAGSGG